MSRSLIYLVAGARPNFMKIAPIVRALRARADRFEFKIVHTGQHYVICQGRCHGLQTAVSVSFGLSGAGLSQTTPGLDQSLVGPRQRSGRAALAC